jgi:hypothetical protein
MFPSSGEGRKTPTLQSPLEKANLNHWAQKSALTGEPDTVGFVQFAQYNQLTCHQSTENDFGVCHLHPSVRSVHRALTLHRPYYGHYRTARISSTRNRVPTCPSLLLFAVSTSLRTLHYLTLFVYTCFNSLRYFPVPHFVRYISVLVLSHLFVYPSTAVP